jgi:hypothetical protein
VLRKTDLDPAGDKADHTLTIPTATTDLLYQPSSESNYDYGREVYKVGQGDQPPLKRPLKKSSGRLMRR